MDNNVEATVKALVTDFKLEEALDILIAQAQTQNQRKQNALLVLKGKLAMLEEQRLSGMIDPEDVARQKAAIAHQILDIADGSSLDFEMPAPPQEQVLVQKTVNAPTAVAPLVRYLLIGLGFLVVGFLLLRLLNSKTDSETAANHPDRGQPVQPTADDPPFHHENSKGNARSDGALIVQDFPNLKKPFNFLDFGLEFVWADAEWISDSEIRLKVRYYLTCKSNLGVCYRADVRIHADGKPIAPADQSNLDGWIAHNATASDDLNFVLPADAKEFLIEFSRDHSTWKRPFKILR